jgi:hypothetical protein
MNVIKNNLSAHLTEQLLSIYEDYKDNFDTTLNKINAITFYNSFHKNPKYFKLLESLQNECQELSYYFEKYQLIYIQIANNPINCSDQFFHLDYKGDSVSVIIPLTKISSLNGTKYLFFYAAHFEIKKLVFTAFWSKITFFLFFKKSIEVFKKWTFLKCPFFEIDPDFFLRFL